MRHPQFILNLTAKLVIVVFAGAGGSCTGIEKAIGRHVDYAINHNANALSCHQANHPQTKHLVEDAWHADPRELAGGRAVGYMHFSPDCTHFSQAKGGQPRSGAIRSLPWVTVKWCGTVRPEVFSLENVKEIRKWGPLIAKRDKATGRVVKLDGTIAAAGEHVPRHEQFLVPNPKRIGHTWRKFLSVLRGMGYDVDDRVLCAADYDVPQQRNRLFVVGRCDGRPIVWPEPVRAKEPAKIARAVRGADGRPVKPLPRWRAAHECIDWSIKGKSIFDRKKPLAPATLKRIARGMDKFVLNSADPFIVPVTHTTSGERVHGIRDPLPVVTTAKGGELMLASPVLVQAAHGEGKPGGVQRRGAGVRDIRDAMPTLTASGSGGQAVATAFLAQMNGGFNDERGTPGHDLREAMSTTNARGSGQMLVAANLAHLRNNCDARDLRAPLQAVSAGGEHHMLVEYQLSAEAQEGALRCAAFVMEYYSQGGQWSDLRKPFNTVTTKDRLALVTVWIKGDPYVVVDICIRMLTPRELANASTFPPQYILSHGHDGRVFTKSQQVFFIGNCVPPELQYHVTAAIYSDEPQQMLEAA
jgi:DNA (cytosine-5)-methyltransferase 1